MKVTITRPDGTRIEAEGTSEECRHLVWGAEAPAYVPANWPYEWIGKPYWGVIPPHGPVGVGSFTDTYFDRQSTLSLELAGMQLEPTPHPNADIATNTQIARESLYDGTPD